MAKLLIFDCDGVLVDSEVLAIRAEERVLAEIGFPMTADEIAETCVGLSYPDMMALLEERFAKPVPEGLEQWIQDEAIAAFPSELREVPGIGGVLTRSGQPRCVASSGTPERIALSLGITGLDRAFDPAAIFSSTLVANGKPAPDLFLHSAEQMGFRPADCIVIEDSAHGITAAKAAGMTAIGFTAGGHIRPSSIDKLVAAGTDYVVADALALEATLMELVSR